MGKTCIAQLLIGRQVHQVSETTIGFDLHCKELIVDGVPLVVSKTHSPDCLYGTCSLKAEHTSYYICVVVFTVPALYMEKRMQLVYTCMFIQLYLFNCLLAKYRVFCVPTDCVVQYV